MNNRKLNSSTLPGRLRGRRSSVADTREINLPSPSSKAKHLGVELTASMNSSSSESIPTRFSLILIFFQLSNNFNVVTFLFSFKLPLIVFFVLAKNLQECQLLRYPLLNPQQGLLLLIVNSKVFSLFFLSTPNDPNNWINLIFILFFRCVCKFC